MDVMRQEGGSAEIANRDEKETVTRSAPMKEGNTNKGSAELALIGIEKEDGNAELPLIEMNNGNGTRTCH